jgi:hypothetical protein
MKKLLILIVAAILAVPTMDGSQPSQPSSQPATPKSSWATKAGAALAAAATAAALYFAGTQTQQHTTELNRRDTTVDQNRSILLGAISDKLNELGFNQDQEKIEATVDYAEALALMSYQLFICLSPQARKEIVSRAARNSENDYNIFSMFTAQYINGRLMYSDKANKDAQGLYNQIRQEWSKDPNTMQSIETVFAQLVNALAQDEINNKAYNPWTNEQLKGEHDRLSMDIAKINSFEYGQNLSLYKKIYVQGGAYIKKREHQGD